MRCRGFTLVELMITVALLGLILMVGVPLTQSWTNSSYQRDAAGLLKQGISRAKATALRNQGAVQDSAPAAVLCRSGQNLKLFRLNAGQSIDCNATSQPVWSSTIPAAAGIKVAGVDMACVAFSNRGLAVSGNSCSTGTLQVTAGSESSVDVPLI
ncbi:MULTISPECIES: pilus assembly FimT family protein [Pseudomonas]|uniref:Prepilin-type N-terminal cleavage/methylation domain-containing protein n=1 Tax=Pseudomonas asplenii TaxID=53407 RepID=A0A0N0E4R4_9PSED|nr:MULTISPECIES: prepilin-type N-terminal cleavage/methylation domain-containing protein [Pseudomonas]KPA91581.1 prepilin-type N-terminal cleavage/methylation domain-containing protein [Pseudomonas fuscovaginae]KPA96357.1 prepilin-type N-terminal cleavage/methylation domain-containing protein [Pseudomonas fuscovaginae]